ncbi:MAG: glycosyltransferase [Leptolyngbyaceae cyanobacterium SM1_3_5]|nr:glycosyltransferase [Leptolyngbyaceae cyanobacterium SM1_3_5]
MADQADRAVIPPVLEIDRPLWSVMIPTYNCADYLRQTLTSVLAQDPGADVMQIQVVDDHSTLDDPEAVVKELGQGRVEFYRQPHNKGYIRNFETCLQRSHGHLVHLLHGDDYVLDGFYQHLQQAFEQHPEIGAAFCRHWYVNESGEVEAPSPLELPEGGILPEWLERIASGQRLTTPSIAVRRLVYEQLGGFDRRFVCAGEDWEMWVRIAAHYPVWFEPEPLAAYRVTRAGSLTAGAARNHRLVQDMRKATEIIESYLSNHLAKRQADRAAAQARRLYASWALGTAEKLLITQDWQGAIAQIEEALRCSRALAIRRDVLRLRCKIQLSSLRQRMNQWKNAGRQAS